MKYRIVPLMLSGTITLLVTSVASAGLVRVAVDKGTSAGIATFVFEGPLFSAGATDVNNDGIIEFAIPPEIQVHTFGVAICKESDGRDLYYNLRFQVGQINLASLEPFEVPTFAALAADIGLVAVVDIVTLLAEGNPFVSGQVISIADGVVLQTSTILFRNGLALPSDPVAATLALLDPEFVNALPTFSGLATVEPVDVYEPIPEPSSLVLVGIGIVGLLRAGHRRIRLK